MPFLGRATSAFRGPAGLDYVRGFDQESKSLTNLNDFFSHLKEQHKMLNHNIVGCDFVIRNHELGAKCSATQGACSFEMSLGYWSGSYAGGCKV